MHLAVIEFSGTIRIFPLAFVFWPMTLVFMLVDAVKVTAASICSTWNGAFRENAGGSAIGMSLH